MSRQRHPDSFLPAAEHATKPDAPPFDISTLDMSSSEAVARSLDLVVRAVAAGSLSPSVGKSVASIATVLMSAHKYSVDAKIREMQARIKEQDRELRGYAGRRTGTR